MADRKFRVVVVGAGVAGLFMAETLKRAGIDFTVYEKAGEVGGTWRDNTFQCAEDNARRGESPS